jgi:hypothetical protein
MAVLQANHLLNRGKDQRELDLASAEGQAVAWQLIRQADVIVENFSPGTMARFGLGPEQVRAACPVSSIPPFEPAAAEPQSPLARVVGMNFRPLDFPPGFCAQQIVYLSMPGFASDDEEFRGLQAFEGLILAQVRPPCMMTNQ